MSLDAIFSCCGQSLLVASYLLRDDRLFQVERMRADMFDAPKRMHATLGTYD